jgi:hypothetical protein
MAVSGAPTRGCDRMTALRLLLVAVGLSFVPTQARAQDRVALLRAALNEQSVLEALLRPGFIVRFDARGHTADLAAFPNLGNSAGARHTLENARVRCDSSFRCDPIPRGVKVVTADLTDIRGDTAMVDVRLWHMVRRPQRPSDWYLGGSLYRVQILRGPDSVWRAGRVQVVIG